MNVHSVRNKTNILRDYITDNLIDIFCLTETWLNEKETAIISEFVPETHVFHHFPREGRGGGVGVVLAKFFKGIKSFRHKYDFFECIQVDFEHVNRAFTIFVIYRAPSTSFSHFAAEYEGF